MEDDAPLIEPGRGRLVYDKARRTIVSQEPDLAAELKRRTTERDYHMRVADQLANEVNRLQTENWQLKQACGYPIPADKETPQNPFKCGICDARARCEICDPPVTNGLWPPNGDRQ